MKRRERWIAAWDAMDERRQNENLELAESDALDYPAKRVPKLRLLTVGDGDLRDHRDSLRNLHDASPAFVVRSIEKRKKPDR